MNKEVRIGRSINILSNNIKRRIDNELSQYNLTGIQGRIIGYVFHESSKRDIFQKNIEEEFNIRRSSVTSVLKLMEKNGYIKRVSVRQDARLKKIVLTEKGLETQKVIHGHILKIEETLQSELGNDEKDLLVKLITRLSEKISH